MDFGALIVAVLVVAVLSWLVNKVIPLEHMWRQIANAVIGVAFIIFLLKWFGLLGGSAKLGAVISLPFIA